MNKAAMWAALGIATALGVRALMKESERTGLSAGELLKDKLHNTSLETENGEPSIMTRAISKTAESIA